jgi:hypothetical protein
MWLKEPNLAISPVMDDRQATGVRKLEKKKPWLLENGEK